MRGLYALKRLENRLCRVYESLRGGNSCFVRSALALAKEKRLHPLRFAVTVVHIKHIAPDGTAVYRGDGKETTDFTVNIRECGVYTVVVQARHSNRNIKATEPYGRIFGGRKQEKISEIIE